MSFLQSLQARWVPVRAALAGLLRRPERLWSLHSLVWLAAGLALAALLCVLALIPTTPGVTDIRKAKSELPAQLMSVDGKLLAEYRWANREWVELGQISPHVVDALIATEDHRFYDHWGMDWRRTISSVLLTLRGDPQGGSTLTQQLVRNLFPEEIGRSRAFPQVLTRKLKESITALKIEAAYSKDEILETYLNTVPFLYGAYGIEMAARTYFDKSADKLDLLESATLIGMLKGTAYYNPVLNPERALARRNTVLSQMKKRGKLEAAQFDALQKRPLRVNFERQTEVMGPAPHFAQQLRRQLIDWADSHGYSLYTDGLVIRTTIDSRLQNFANQAVARQGKQLQGVADAAWSKRDGWGPKSELVQTLVRESAEYRAALDKGQPPGEALQALLDDEAFLQKLRAEKTRVQAGFLAQDPVTGHVLAWVGSRDFGQDPFDHVQAARRQPGSTFKPFVYGAAFAQGASPDDTLMDSAVEIPLPGGRVWRPTDGGPPSDEPMTLADGLALSKNTITAQVMQQVGPARVAEVARALGVRQSPLEEVPSLALGTGAQTCTISVSNTAGSREIFDEDHRFRRYPQLLLRRRHRCHRGRAGRGRTRDRPLRQLEERVKRRRLRLLHRRLLSHGLNGRRRSSRHPSRSSPAPPTRGGVRSSTLRPPRRSSLREAPSHAASRSRRAAVRGIRGRRSGSGVRRRRRDQGRRGPVRRRPAVPALRSSALPRHRCRTAGTTGRSRTARSRPGLR